MSRSNERTHIKKKAFDQHFEAQVAAWKVLADMCEEVSFKKNERIKEANSTAKFGYFREAIIGYTSEVLKASWLEDFRSFKNFGSLIGTSEVWLAIFTLDPWKQGGIIMFTTEESTRKRYLKSLKIINIFLSNMEST